MIRDSNLFLSINLIYISGLLMQSIVLPTPVCWKIRNFFCFSVLSEIALKLVLIGSRTKVKQINGKVWNIRSILRAAKWVDTSGRIQVGCPSDAIVSGKGHRCQRCDHCGASVTYKLSNKLEVIRIRFDSMKLKEFTRSLESNLKQSRRTCERYDHTVDSIY